MKKADEIIGGGSKYSDDNLAGNFSLVPKTYEDAASEYEQFLEKDKITGAYARLYCDYLGIDLSILPVFVAVSLANLDRKSRMDPLVYVKKISSAKLIFTRYCSLIAVMLVPVILTAASAYGKVKNSYPDQELNHTAIVIYAAFWLVPDIMAASAVGMFFTEISSGLFAIFVQGVWWFASTMAGTGGLTGNIGKFTLVMRHNSLSGYDVFHAEYGNIVFNRIFFAMFSILLAVLTAVIYEKKRTGYLSVCLIRLLYSLFFLAVLFGLFLWRMDCLESVVGLRHFIGGYGSALFLGALGFFSAGVSQNSIVGYMVSMIYYISNFILKDDLKNLYLFSMSAGSYQEKYWLIGGSAILFLVTFAWIKFRKSA